MATFEVKGGYSLKGEIIPQGAKNEALQIISATLMTPEEVVISNIPEILDVVKLIELLQSMGVEVVKIQEGEYSFMAKNINVEYLQTEDFKKQASSLRGSVMIIGPLLSRFGKAYLPKPGGDKIGRRRLDTHIIGFQKLGAEFHYNQNEDFFHLEGKNLKGCYMLLDEASVTGTANIVMAAAHGKGTNHHIQCCLRTLYSATL
jgi:UDP-N-acetylglucosamine 1-carboxyvinyltransferase